MTNGPISSGRCPRCDGLLSVPPMDPECSNVSAPIDCGVELDADTVPLRPPVDLNDWDVTERLKRIERLLACQLVTDPKTPWNEPPIHRVDLSHLTGPSMVRWRSAGTYASRRRSSVSLSGHWAALLFAFFGTMTWFVGMAASIGLAAVSTIAEAGFAIPLQTAGICLLLASTFTAIAQVSISNRRLLRRIDSLEAMADGRCPASRHAFGSGSVLHS